MQKRVLEVLSKCGKGGATKDAIMATFVDYPLAPPRARKNAPEPSAPRKDRPHNKLVIMMTAALTKEISLNRVRSVLCHSSIQSDANVCIQSDAHALLIAGQPEWRSVRPEPLQPAGQRQRGNYTPFSINRH